MDEQDARDRPGVTDPQELLDAYARYDDFADAPGIPLQDITPRVFAALRAVLDLHKPEQYGDEDEEFDDPDRQWCTECSGDSFHRERFPCRTRWAITAALEDDTEVGRDDQRE